VARLGILHRHRTADEDATQTVDRTVPDTTRDITDDSTTVRRPVRDTTAPRVDEPTPTRVERPRWARVSAMATLGLIVGLASLGATLTGLLAPVGVAVGIVGGAISAGGLVGASRRGVTGHSIALLGLLASIAAIVLGLMAIGGYLPWLDSHTNEVARARDWLDARFPWMKNW
jgi:hypothetical protein